MLSNLDSYVNSASTLVVTDIYKPFLRPAATDRECLRLGRWLVVGFVVVGAAASYLIDRWFGTVFEAFQTFLSLFQGPLLALLLLGMLIGIATAVSVKYYHLVLGSGSDISFLWAAWWSFVAAVLSALAVSLVTRPYDTERLRGLVCWIPMSETPP